MISIKKKEDCCGCEACRQICPRKCIHMCTDEGGFCYPSVNVSECIECDMCEKVCPVINQMSSREPLAVWAAKNDDDQVRMSSSSGGIFYMMAERVINEGGVVFGARFDEDWAVVHGFAETIDEVKAFQGSKYVQSRINDSYLKAEVFLKSGRRVMFTGTPCQVAGLKLYLRKDWGNQLLLVDVVCHGVPSPAVWEEYLKEITRPEGAGKNSVFCPLNNDKMSVITDISFRDKRNGWQKYGFAVRFTNARQGVQNTVLQPHSKTKEIYEVHLQNKYMRGFLKDVILRPSCFQCPSKKGKSHSDITLGDFWGIDNIAHDFNDDRGVSLVLCNTELGLTMFESLPCDVRKMRYEDAINGNPAIIQSPRRPNTYKWFWRHFPQCGMNGVERAAAKVRHPLHKRIVAGFKYLIYIISHKS